MEHLDARLAYEVALGKRISDRSWGDIKRLMSRHRLEITVDNVQFFVELRKEIPRSAIGVVGILECYQKANKILQCNETLKGSRILEILGGYGIEPHQTTISRWFAPIGGYRRDRIYSSKKLKGLLTKAFIYKAHFTNSLPQGVNHG